MRALRFLNYFATPADPRFFRWLLPLLFALALPLYFHAAHAHSATFNHDRLANDQNVFLILGKKITETGGEAMTERQRTPGFGYLLAPFWSSTLKDETDSNGISEAWFERAKGVSIALSMVLLLILLAAGMRVMPVVEATLLAFALAFLLFVFRGGYCQPEPTYWTLNVITYYLAGRMLVRPHWLLAVATGVVAAAAFLMKAGIQPLLILYVASLFVKLAWERFFHKRPVTLGHLALGLLVPLTYCLVLAPYLINSYRIFGNPFFNSHAKYMMWIPDGDRTQMHALQNVESDRHLFTRAAFQAEVVRLKLRDDKTGTLRAEDITLPEIPSLGTYVSEHGFSELLWRSPQGIAANHKRMVKYYPDAYKLLQLLLWVAAGVSVLAWRRVLPDLRDFLPVVLYVLGFFVGYLLLYGWYDGLRIGVRLILSLYLPAVFTLIYFIGHYSSGLRIHVRGQPIYVRKILNIALAVILAVLSHSVLTGALYRNYSGA